jgi:hypothetical protein
MLHAGRYREANFFLGQALEEWPSDRDLLALQGRTLVLSGLYERGVKVLRERLDASGPEPLNRVFLALALFFHAGGNQENKERLPANVATQASLAELIEEALASTEDVSAEVRTQTNMLAGWALSVLPPPFCDQEQGIRLLSDTLRKIQKGARGKGWLPGMRERYLINTAYLLLKCAEKVEATGKGRALAKEVPSAKELRVLICSLDPGSTFAQKVFLEDG